MPVSTELSLEYLIPDVTLGPGPRSLLDANGSALVIHAGKDDYMRIRRVRLATDSDAAILHDGK